MTSITALRSPTISLSPPRAQCRGDRRLADRLPPGSAEPSVFGLVAAGGLDYEPPPMVEAGPAVASLEGRPESLYLYNVKADPHVRPVIDRVLQDLYSRLDVDPAEVTKEEAYVFLSGGPSTTSAHVDHEHNFLLLLRGRKRVFIADVPSPEGELALEALHSGRYGSCAVVPEAGREFDIGPGEGVYIPPRAAHYVVNGDVPCAALSIVFGTRAPERQSDLYAANALLRRAGLTPTAPQVHPTLDRASRNDHPCPPNHEAARSAGLKPPWLTLVNTARHLLDSHAGDGPADHELLDLLGAFENVVGLSQTCPLVTVGPFCIDCSTRTLTSRARWLPLFIATPGQE